MFQHVIWNRGGRFWINWSAQANSLQTRLIKVGARVVRHSRTITFQRAGIAVSCRLPARVLTATRGLCAPPVPTWRHQHQNLNKSGTTGPPETLPILANIGPDQSPGPKIATHALQILGLQLKEPESLDQRSIRRQTCGGDFQLGECRMKLLGVFA